jgi:hypothetical protein
VLHAVAGVEELIVFPLIGDDEGGAGDGGIGGHERVKNVRRAKAGGVGLSSVTAVNGAGTILATD